MTSTFFFLKHWNFEAFTISLYLFWNVFEPPYLVLQSLHFTTLRRYLPENRQCFTPWILHSYLNKRLLQWFSCFSWSAGHVNVEINELDLLKYFIKELFFFLLPLDFFAEIKWFVFPWDCYLPNLATLLFTTFEITKHSTFP